MIDKKIIQEIAGQTFASSKELKNQAITIKKIVTGIEKQQKRLSKYLKLEEITVISKAATILSDYITVFNQAAKENEKQAKEKAAKREKEQINHLESMIINDFGSLSPDNLLAECKLFKEYLEATKLYTGHIKDIIYRYEKNQTPVNFQIMKSYLANELEEFSFGYQNRPQEFEAFKLIKLDKKS